MTVWPQLCNSRTKEVPNPEKQLLLVDIVMFSWIKTNALQKQIFSSNSANAYFHFRLLDLCPTSISLSAKAGCFLITSNIPVDVFLTSQQNFWLHWCPLIPHRSHSMIHPWYRLPSCFKPASLLPLSPRAILQLQGENLTPTTVKNCCTISARRTCPLKSGQWATGYGTRAASCLRWVTGRWHPLAVKHTPNPRREQGWHCYVWSCPMQEYWPKT